MKKKVMVGMSGGVDSSVAALLLKEQGYEVVGVTFRLWTPEELNGVESGCCSVDDVNDAKFVCHALDIPHYVFNYRDLFREKVVNYFVAEYERGATPNPCIACNRHIKFDAFLSKAKSMGFDYIATGHYASILQDRESGRWLLKKGKFDHKDQSYVLYCLNQEQLASTLMPLGNYKKEEVRVLAERKGLVVSGKPDSQDICFVPDGNYGEFLKGYTGREPTLGDIVDTQGKTLGNHRGIWCYTIGQRRGLGISIGRPAFVCDIDAVNNRIVLGSSEDLMHMRLLAEEVNWIFPEPPKEGIRAAVKIRYTHKPATALVKPVKKGIVEVIFDSPQRAATKGQAIVFYHGDYVAGGATICDILPEKLS